MRVPKSLDGDFRKCWPRDELPGQPGIVALPVPKPYGRHGGFAKSAVDESLPDAVGAFVEWLLKASGWKVTERDRPGEALPISARHVCLLFRRFTSWGQSLKQRTKHCRDDGSELYILPIVVYCNEARPELPR